MGFVNTSFVTVYLWCLFIFLEILPWVRRSLSPKGSRAHNLIVLEHSNSRHGPPYFTVVTSAWHRKHTHSSLSSRSPVKQAGASLGRTTSIHAASKVARPVTDDGLLISKPTRCPSTNLSCTYENQCEASILITKHLITFDDHPQLGYVCQHRSLLANCTEFVCFAKHVIREPRKIN